jgi:spore maturation protein CgeB
LKFLLVEYWHSHIYAEAFFQRLRELGVEVSAFKEFAYFSPSTVAARAQDKFRIGPRLARLNADLVQRVKIERPNVVFVFRGSHLWPSTLRAIKRTGAKLICWNNDDPFSARYPWWVWRHFKRGIAEYDLLFGYRASNVDEYKRRGCKTARLLRSFYLRELNFPVEGDALDPYRCDVSFIGHWENDSRDAYIAAVLHSGVKFRLWGTLWERSPLFPELCARFGQIRPVYRDEYNLAINASKISLVFLSGLNNDTYTRRCFEIPGARAFMLSQRTSDLESLFQPGVEAEFFSTANDMLVKIRRYVNDDEARRRIAAAGYKRVRRDGHEALDRAREVLEAVRAMA